MISALPKPFRLRTTGTRDHKFICKLGVVERSAALAVHRGPYGIRHNLKILEEPRILRDLSGPFPCVMRPYYECAVQTDDESCEVPC